MDPDFRQDDAGRDWQGATKDRHLFFQCLVPNVDIDATSEREPFVHMRQMIILIAMALSGCKATPPTVELAQCWDSRELPISEGSRVNGRDALVLYSPDGPTTLHPADCDGRPIWLGVAEATLAEMRADQSTSDWNGGKFFRADIIGIATVSENAPLGLVVRITEIRNLRRVGTPPRFKAVSFGRHLI